MRFSGVLGLAWLLGVAAAGWEPLYLDQAIINRFNDSSGWLVIAPSTALNGVAVGTSPANNASHCASVCEQTKRCTWFNYCKGCNGTAQGSGASECILLSSNCTLVPQAIEVDEEDLAAGFVVRASLLSVPGYATRVAQGVEGSDLTCAGSLLPDRCAFRDPLDAIVVCTWMPHCTAVTVLTQGMDGCSEELAVLKTSNLAPSNSYMAPTVYTIEEVEAVPLAATYLHLGEADILTVSDEEMEAASSASDTLGVNSTAWLGCIVAPNTVMPGGVVRVLDGVPSAEACCRACREELPAGACNTWNWCPPGVNNCTYSDLRLQLLLTPNQCELRFQELVLASQGFPPAVTAKGPSIAFTAGAPIIAVGPPQPGFKRRIGQGLFGQRGFSCPETVKPELPECVIRRPLEGLAEFCLEDPECRAFMFKPGGVFMSPMGVGVFKHFANESGIILNPSTVLYLRDSSTKASRAGPYHLPAGAIVGISLAVVAAAGACSWGLLLWRRRLHRRRRSASSDAQEAGEAGPKPSQHSASQLGNGLSAVNGLAGGATSMSAKPPPPVAVRSVACSSPAVQASTNRYLALLTASLPAEEQAAPASLTTLSPFALAATRSSQTLAPRTMSSGPEPAAAGSGPGSGPASASGSAFVPPPAGSSSRTDSGSAFTAPLGPEPEVRLVELEEHVASQDELLALQASPRVAGPHPIMLPASLPDPLRDWVIPPDQITFLRRANGNLQELGSGASGHVIKATYRGEIIAVKQVDLGRSKDVLEAFITEASRMQLLRHPNVVNFFGVSVDGTAGLILMEYCEARDLSCALQLHLRSDSTQRLFGWYRRGWRVALDVARAINYLHGKNVVHMDVKSSNVLLTAGGTAKLGDVGLSRLQTKTFLSDLPLVGTFAWVAPEVLMGGQGCTFAVDIYSFGVLMWEIVTGERPSRGRLRLPRVPEECPQEVDDLMMECMSLQPADRPTAQQLLARLMELCSSMGSRTPSSSLVAPPP